MEGRCGGKCGQGLWGDTQSDARTRLQAGVEHEQNATLEQDSSAERMSDGGRRPSKEETVQLMLFPGQVETLARTCLARGRKEPATLAPHALHVRAPGPHVARPNSRQQ